MQIPLRDWSKSISDRALKKKLELPVLSSSANRRDNLRQRARQSSKFDPNQPSQEPATSNCTGAGSVPVPVPVPDLCTMATFVNSNPLKSHTPAPLANHVPYSSEWALVKPGFDENDAISFTALRASTSMSRTPTFENAATTGTPSRARPSTFNVAACAPNQSVFSPVARLSATNVSTPVGSAFILLPQTTPSPTRSQYTSFLDSASTSIGEERWGPASHNRFVSTPSCHTYTPSRVKPIIDRPPPLKTS